MRSFKATSFPRAKKLSLVAYSTDKGEMFDTLRSLRSQPNTTRISAIVRAPSDEDFGDFTVEGRIKLNEDAIFFIGWNDPSRPIRPELEISLPSPIDPQQHLLKLRELGYKISIETFDRQTLDELIKIQKATFTDYTNPLTPDDIGSRNILAIARSQGRIVSNLVGVIIELGDVTLVDLDHGATLPDHRNYDIMVVLAHLIEQEVTRKFENTTIFVQAGTSFPAVNSCCAKFGMTYFGKRPGEALLTVGEQPPGFETLNLWFK